LNIPPRDLQRGAAPPARPLRVSAKLAHFLLQSPPTTGAILQKSE
jgi:hypothetical protein